MQIDEFTNGAAPESVGASEFVPVNDNAAVLEGALDSEFQPAGEFADQQEQSTQSRGRTSRQQALSALSGGLAATIAAVAVGITGLLNVGMNAKFVDDGTRFSDGNIQYEITVNDMTDKETLSAYFYDGDDLVEVIPLTDEDGDGHISGTIALDSAAIEQKLGQSDNATITYRLTLKGMVGLNVERTFDSYVLKIDEIHSKFEQVSGYCRCAVDGYYHFTMDFEDDKGIFTDFSAYIIDSFNNRVDCKFTDNLHEEQKIYIGNTLKGSSATLYITYLADGEEQIIQEDISI